MKTTEEYVELAEKYAREAVDETTIFDAFNSQYNRKAVASTTYALLAQIAYAKEQDEK